MLAETYRHMGIRSYKRRTALVKRHKTPKEFIPKADEALNLYKSGKSRKKITEAFLRTITMGTSYNLELELTTTKGTPIWVRVVGISEFINGICLRQYVTLEGITSGIKRE